MKVNNASKLTCAVHAAYWVKLQYIECSSLFVTGVVSRRCGDGVEGGNGSKMIFEQK